MNWLWVDVVIPDRDKIYELWCRDYIGPCGVNWYISSERLAVVFRNEEYASVFRKQFKL